MPDNEMTARPRASYAGKEDYMFPINADNLPPLELDTKNISAANDASQFNAGDVLAKEAESVYRKGIEDMFSGFPSPNPQQAEIMADRAASWKELCEKSYNDVIRLRASWFPWTVSGPARYDQAKNSQKANRQMEVSLQWAERREAFIENTKRMIRDALPLSEIIEEYRTGKREDPVSSDDPAAVEKLQARIDFITEQHERGKTMNKHWKKFGTMKNFPGMEDEKAEALDDFIKKQPPIWQLPYSRDTANVTATIRRLRERIENIQKLRRQAEKDDDPEKTYDGFAVKKNLEENRLCIEFDGKPDEDVRAILKGNGFHWSPRNKVWQRQLTDNAFYALENLVIPSIQDLMAREASE